MALSTYSAPGAVIGLNLTKERTKPVRRKALNPGIGCQHPSYATISPTYTQVTHPLKRVGIFSK